MYYPRYLFYIVFYELWVCSQLVLVVFESQPKNIPTFWLADALLLEQKGFNYNVIIWSNNKQLIFYELDVKSASMALQILFSFSTLFSWQAFCFEASIEFCKLLQLWTDFDWNFQKLFPRYGMIQFR